MRPDLAVLPPRYLRTKEAANRPVSLRVYPERIVIAAAFAAAARQPFPPRPLPQARGNGADCTQPSHPSGAYLPIETPPRRFTLRHPVPHHPPGTPPLLL